MPLVSAGSPAPDFSLNDQHGETVTRESLAGRWAVIYFYPRDNTPGCTREACNFRDNHAAIEALDARVIGVSGDSEASHQKFAEKYELPFTLLVDTGNTMARAYGAWGEKKNYGKTYEGIIRSTVVIDPAGNVAKVWPRVKPDEHGAEVLAWLKANAA
ncbi:MAG TPA: thioredoxin-dependent thiol peroxidase [Tepidiformaceae bacterium]|nr:thioredoxin-dependent thiol peroxidase [Tepidiformaceae bacterium]